MSVDINVEDNDITTEKNSIHCLRYSNAVSNSNTSLRNALILGYSNYVAIYDVLNQKVTKTIKLSQYDSKSLSSGDKQSSSNGLRLTTLAVNQRLGRGHVAVGGKYGHLRIISLTSEVSGAPAIDPKIQDITDLCFSRFKQSLLAGSTESGAVVLWDANTVKRTSFFNEHKAPASGLSFSPTNEMLLSSVGLDKHCLCYDVLSGKTAATIKTNEPLTCVDFRQDGITISLGTSKGKIFVYDLRTTKVPCQVLEPHPGRAVKCLLYQSGNDGKALAKNRSSSLLKQTSKKNMLSEVCKENVPISVSTQSAGEILGSPSSKFKKVVPAQNETPSPVYFSPAPNDNSTDQMFSPLGGVISDVELNFKALDTHSKNTSNHSNFSRLSSDSLFSPLREKSTNLMSSFSNGGENDSPAINFLQSGSKMFTSPLPMIAETNYEHNSYVSSKKEHNMNPKLSIAQRRNISELTINDASPGIYNSTAENNTTPLVLKKSKEKECYLPSYEIQNNINNSLQMFRQVPITTEGALQCNKGNEIHTNTMALLVDKQHIKHRENHTSIVSSRQSTIEDKCLDYVSKPFPISSTKLQEPNAPTNVSDTDCSSKDIPKSVRSSLTSKCSFDTISLGIVPHSSDKHEVFDIKSMMMAFPEALTSSPFKVSTNTQEVNSRCEGIACMNEPTVVKSDNHVEEAKQFERSYLKSVVTESMDEFASEVRKQLWHMEWDLTKNFQLLKQENEQKQEGFNKIYESMMLENEKLRHENEQLKKSRHFFQQN